MKIIKMIVILLLIGFCSWFLSADNSMARRKKSFLGEALDAVKEGAGRVKKDIVNYNTFIVQIYAKNKSKERIKLFYVKYKSPENIKKVTFGYLNPGTSKTFKLEISTPPIYRRVHFVAHAVGDDPSFGVKKRVDINEVDEVYLIYPK